MGLTNNSTGSGVLETELHIVKKSPSDKIIALGGNPNVGKSTVFNHLTGLKQHTGNWPGKTVTNAHGVFTHQDTNFILVDIPGTYSLMANSVEEEVARDFICFGQPDTTVIVVDATCLERNLNLVLQTMEITPNVIVCVNLLDEARRKGISVDLNKLSKNLGLPVVGTSATKGDGLNQLVQLIYANAYASNFNTPISITYEEKIEQAISLLQVPLNSVLDNQLNSRWVALKLLENDQTLLASMNKYLGFDLSEDIFLMNIVKDAKSQLSEAGITNDIFRDKIVSSLVTLSEEISQSSTTFKHDNYTSYDRKIDHYLTSKKYGIPLMILMLVVVLWLTITGSNYPSELLSTFLFWIEDQLTTFFLYLGTPDWVHGLLVEGVYRTLAWVVAVMLPPMAIFFPLFTLLEDLGYLPRVAFNLDNYFQKAHACGKQALTMCMGFGCNAAGIVGCRIIDSPRERLIATLTNNFVPCNGRFPILIAITTMFFTGMFIGPFQSIISTLILVGVILLGIFMTFVLSRLLSKTILKGIPSDFTLELPPYRKPQVGKVIVRSIFDRTLFVLGRAMAVAAPAGLVIWGMANITIGDISLLTHCADFLNPFAQMLGMDGYILMAFILGFPANEIVIPIIIMSYMATGSMLELDNLTQLKTLLVDNGWTWLTAVSVMLFSLMHWPCATTCLTIKKETQSIKWTILSFLIPTIVGIIICFIFATSVRLFGLV